MKPDWDKLAKEFQGSDSVLIADVDCTVQKDLCKTYGVRGYPTIKYFTGSTGSDGAKYEGARDFAGLKKFASESLGPSCSNDNIDLCDDAQKAILAEGNAMTSAERAAFIKSAEDAKKAANTEFDEALEGLNARYKELVAEKEAKLEALDTPEIALYNTIKD